MHALASIRKRFLKRKLGRSFHSFVSNNKSCHHDSLNLTAPALKTMVGQAQTCCRSVRQAYAESHGILLIFQRFPYSFSFIDAL